MIIAGIYPFNGASEIIEARYGSELKEITDIIAGVDGIAHKTKVSREKTMPGRMLYRPGSMNKAFKREFEDRGWQKHRVLCEYPTQYYVPGYATSATGRGAFREIDFVKNGVGVEIQFGKYAFMVYNVCAKMTIFHKLGLIHGGVEFLPVKSSANEMSTGVSYFEQIVWDLEQRGIADIDIPVLILGVAE